MSIKKRILPILLILALVPSLMAVPISAVNVDESDGIFNLLVSTSYNLYRNGTLYQTGIDDPNVYVTAYVNSLAFEWSPVFSNRADYFYFTVFADRVPDKVTFKPFNTTPLNVVYLGSNGYYHQYRCHNPTNLGALTVICDWNERYRGNFGVVSFIGVRNSASEIIDTIDYSAKEMYADSNIISNFNNVASVINASVPYYVWHDSTYVNNHSLDFLVYSTLRPSQHGLKWLQEIQFNVSSCGDSDFTASLIDSNNNPIADLPVTVVEGERVTILINNGFQYPVNNYTVHVDVSGYDLGLYSLKLNSSVGKYLIDVDTSQASYYYQVNAILGVPEVYEQPWYVAMFSWLRKRIDNVADSVVSAINGLAGIFGNNGELEQAGEAMSEQAASMQQVNNQMNAVDKPELDTGQLLGNFLDFNTGGLTILSSMTSNAFVPQLMVVVFTFALCGYIFFGKKG